VPAEQVVRDGKVFLRKQCSKCGVTESLVSNDAAAWQRKRDIWAYDPREETQGCSLGCRGCNISHAPTVVFIDVTNHCNMNCPICIANIRGMGYEFHPPMEYFERMFKELATFKPLPMLQLFGGEPTLREDLFDIVKLARGYGLKSRIVTNGLRLADEAYCRKLCEAGIRVLLAFDGRHPDIYRRMRKSGDACEKKLKALANLQKYSRRKNTILCCAARTINDQYMGDLLDLCHESNGKIDTLGLIPLTENWDPNTFETGVNTTREDAEHMIEACVPGGAVEFVPAGITHYLSRARAFFRPKSVSEHLILGGVSPDCETISLLVSDGQHFRSANHYLRVPLSEIARQILSLSRKIDGRLSRLDTAKRLDRLRGQYLVLKTFGPLILRAVDFKRLFKGHPILNLLRMGAAYVRGKRGRELTRPYVDAPQVLRVVIFPFEEYHSLDSTHLRACKAVFAYEDVATGRIKTIPACAWNTHRNELLRSISVKYGQAADLPSRTDSAMSSAQSVGQATM
jgi:MoaA/NifB/PqqE/SkfB family radical SAM enzyme